MAFFKRYFLVYVMAAAMAISSAVLISRRFTRLQPVSAPAAPRTVIVIDPGHGGEDGGATAPDGRKESDLNLEISLRLRDTCMLLGLPVEMTRETDVALYSPDCTTLAQKKSSDLRNRTQLVNDIPGALLLSIHQNSFPEAKYFGAQVFYAETAGSQALAEFLQATLCTELDPRNHRVCKPSQDVYLMEHLQCTGVLVECGFLTNPAEETRLQSSEYQKQLACAVAASVFRYLQAQGEV